MYDMKKRAQAFLNLMEHCPAEGHIKGGVECFNILHQMQKEAKMILAREIKCDECRCIDKHSPHCPNHETK